MPSQVRAVAFGLLLLPALLLAGCGDDGGEQTSSGDGASEGSGDPEASGDEGGEAAVEPLPALPDPAPALECDGSEVLCVDAGADGGDGTAETPFATVTEALVVAEPGATVQVAAGTYEEALALDGVEDLSLVGGFPSGGDFSERDPEANETVLQGSEDAAVVTVTASTGVLLEGLHITGGGGFDEGYSRAGGGVYVNAESSDVSIVANRIDGNVVDGGDTPTENVGGGIASTGTGVTIAGNVLDGNTAGRGGGIAVVGEATIDQNTITDNVGLGDHGGGVYVSGDLTITANHIEGNIIDGAGVGYGWGGGVILYGDETTALLQGNVVTANVAPSAGSGVFVDDGADATLVGELYYANECTVEGGVGFFTDSGGETATVVEASYVTIAQHDCPDSPNGGNAVLAVISEEGAPATEARFTDSIFWGNAALDVASLGGEVTITNSIAEAAIEGDGITADGVVEQDPLFVDPAGGDFSLEDGSPAIGAGAGGKDLGSTGAG